MIKGQMETKTGEFRRIDDALSEIIKAYKKKRK